MGSWRSRATFSGDPEKILDLLTDPQQVRAWSPINFEVEDLEADRLQTGAIMHVHGKLAGRRMSFDVEVFKASDGKLHLQAQGPVELEVEYGIDDEGGELHAWVDVRSAGGLIGRVAASATDALLAAGALEQAVKKIARAAEDED
jgi:hypothetical protein